MKLESTAVFQRTPQGYIGFIEELPGANTQGAILDEARKNLAEAAHRDINEHLARKICWDLEVSEP